MKTKLLKRLNALNERNTFEAYYGCCCGVSCPQCSAGNNCACGCDYYWYNMVWLGFFTQSYNGTLEDPAYNNTTVA